MSFRKNILALVAFTAFALTSLTVQAATLKLVNASASQIHAIYLSDSGSDDWEENVIDEYILPSGNELDIQIQGSYEQFDLRVEDGNGNYEDYSNFPGKTKKITIKGGGNSEYQ